MGNCCSNQNTEGGVILPGGDITSKLSLTARELYLIIKV
jgi:hypothetical protein